MNKKVAVLGLSGSGRTSLLQFLKFGFLQENLPQLPEYDVQINGIDIKFQKCELQEECQAIIFCLDGNNLHALPDAKALFDKLSQKQNAVVPWVILQTKADTQTIDPQELAQFLEVERLTDREIMIGSISALTGEGVEEIMSWLTQVLNTKNEFVAEPRVVKSRDKFAPPQPMTKPQQTFVNLMKDKRIRLLDPVQQEQEFLRLEKERIKVENMHMQLNNFKKNKKRMTPYEIKPSPNPRLEVNLEFFLTDAADTIEKMTSTTDTQTDVFQNPPPSPPFVPKKTGIDAATQVEDYELFDFDREVTPILDVVVTKTLEQACLEIEQEEELISMKQFKEAFYRKRDQEKDKQKQVLLAEVNQINKKNDLMKNYLEREERKQFLLRKAQAYQIAGRYLRDLSTNTYTQVIKQGFYPDEFQNKLRTNFMDWLVQRTEIKAKKLYDTKAKLNGTFDGDNITFLQKERASRDAIINKRKERTQRRSVNKGNDNRVLRIVYYDLKPVPSIVALKLPRVLDGTLEEWEKNYEAKIQELDMRFEADYNEDDYINAKRADYPDTPANYLGLSLQNINRISFNLAHNQFYETSENEKKLQMFALLIEKSGRYTLIDQLNNRLDKIIKFKGNIRTKYSKNSDDSAIIIRPELLDEDVCCVLFGLRLPNLQSNSTTQALNDYINNSRFCMTDYWNDIPYDHTNTVSCIKWEELIKVPDNPDQADLPQTGILICYSLTKRFRQFGNWFLESVKQPHKGLIEEEIPKFYTKVSSIVSELWENTCMIDNYVIVKVSEKEKEMDGPIDPSKIYARRRLPQSMKHQGAMSKDNSVSEGAKNLDEPHESVKTILYSRVIRELIVNMNSEFHKLQEQIVLHLQGNEQALIDTFTYGFEILVRGKTFARPKQLLRSRNIGDFIIVRKPDPLPEKIDNTEIHNQEEIPAEEDQ